MDEQPELPLTGWQIELDRNAKAAHDEVKEMARQATERLQELVSLANRSQGQRSRWARVRWQ